MQLRGRAPAQHRQGSIPAPQKYSQWKSKDSLSQHRAHPEKMAQWIHKVSLNKFKYLRSNTAGPVTTRELNWKHKRMTCMTCSNVLGRNSRLLNNPSLKKSLGKLENIPHLIIVMDNPEKCICCNYANTQEKTHSPKFSLFQKRGIHFLEIFLNFKISVFTL